MNKICKILFIVSIIISIITGKIVNFDDVILNSVIKAIKIIFNQGVTIILWSGFLNIIVNQPVFKRSNNFLWPIIHLIFPNLRFNSPAKKFLISNLITNLIGIGSAGTSSALMAIDELKNEKDYFSIMNLTVLNTTSLSIIPLSLISYRKLLNGTISSKLILCHFLITLFSIIMVIIINNLDYKKGYLCLSPS